jgi:capsid portal protein
MWVKFRTIVQEAVTPVVRGSSVVQSGYRLVYFKEFGDPRVYDVDNGDEVSPEQVASWKNTGKPMPHEQRANEVVYWNRYVARTPYGLPRHFANMWGIFGNHQAEKVNYHTLRCNHVPAFMLLVSGNGRLTDGTLDRITEFTKATVEGRNNYGRFLIVECEGEEEDDEPGKIKVEVQPLSGEQIRDALYSKYRKDNQADLRRAYRMPPIFLGATEDYSRAVVDTSRSVGDEQVFAPKRNKFDWWVNHRLFPAMKLEGKHGVRFHEFVTNSPNTTDNKELVQILSGSEKTGGMTPRIARMALEDVFGKDLPPFPTELPNGKPFDPDLPFSLLMADAVKNQADPAEPGQQVTALKVVKMLLGDDAAESDVVSALATLEQMQERIEARWRAELKAGE